MKRREKRVFYGWWVVAAAAVGVCVGTAPLVVFSFGVYVKPLSESFHAGRGAVSLAFTCFNLAQAVAAPLLGRLVDQIGARRVILGCVASLGMTLVGAKLLGTNIAFAYVFFVLLGAVAGGAVFPFSVVVSHWFNRKRGLALGVMMLGIGIGAIAVPPIAQRLIAKYDWQTSYALSGAAVLLITLPVVGLVLRGDPREKGLLADGASAEKMVATTRSAEGIEGLTWSETWHQKEFWVLIGSFFLASASLHACTLHAPALLTDRGVSARDAALASSLVGVALLLGRFGTGYLLDRIFAPRLAMGFFLASASGMALLLFGAAGKLAFAASFLVGLAFGAEVDIIAYSLSRYFGLKAFGTAYGYAFGAFVLAGALGTLLMGVGFDAMRSYTLPLAGFLLSMLLAAGLMLGMGPYRFALKGEDPR